LSVRGHLTVTGGEPFLRPDFMDLLEVFFANRHFFTFAILTNGSFIDLPTTVRLGKLKPSFVQISIEGGRETHDRIRGDGSFDKAVTAIRRLVREGVHTLISFTAHQGNYLEFPFVADLARQMKVARVWADRFIPPICDSSSGIDLSAPRTLNPTEAFRLFKLMHEKRENKDRRRSFRSNRTEVAMHRGLQFLVGGGVPYHCTAGDSLICVMPNGDVYPCRRMPIKAGNLVETPLSQIYRESDILQSLRDKDRVPAGCRACFFSKACRGGLRCLSYALTGSPFEPDPGCRLPKVDQVSAVE
jgi:radical SAM protein with 4Fe4S-binding SPASM domain